MDINESHEKARQEFWQWVYLQETLDEKLEEIHERCQEIQDRIDAVLERI